MPTPPRVLAQRFVPEQSVTEIHEHARNARRGDEEFLSESLDVNGFFGAVVVDERNGDILIGNHRFRMLTRAGGTHVPALWITPDDDAHARRLMLADNQGSDRAHNDLVVLLGLLEEAKATPVGLAGTGFSEEILARLLEESGLPSPPSDGDGESGGTRGPNLQERFGVPPFSVLDARSGVWQSRKREWIAFGIRGDVGRGDSLDAEAEGAAHANASPVDQGGLNQRLAPNVDRPGGKIGKAAPRVNEASAFNGDAEESAGNAAARRRRKARSAARPEGSHGNKATAPFGTPFDGGDAWRGHAAPGEAAHAHKAQARRAALMKTGGSRVGPDGRRMTWAAGTRPLEELDDTSARNAGASTSGASMLDPVLCELMLRWFCPKGGRVLDCFAGGPTLGIVASHLGYDFTGVEVRAEQIAASEAQAKDVGLSPRYVLGDSATIDEAMPGGLFDFVLTDPPYFNLEFYSSNEANGSAKKTYPEFREWYASVLARTAAVLREDRFMVVKIGEARDASGNYVNIVGDTTRILMDAGLRFYNEAILITAIGSLPVRAGRPFVATRKLGKAHQQCLVFLKGNMKRAVASLSEISEADWAIDFDPTARLDLLSSDAGMARENSE